MSSIADRLSAIRGDLRALLKEFPPKEEDGCGDPSTVYRWNDYVDEAVSDLTRALNCQLPDEREW